MRILVGFLVLFAAIPGAAQSASAREMFRDAAGLANSGQFEKALERFGTLLERSESESLSPVLRARIHYNLGVCEYRVGRSKRAVTELEAAIKLRNGEYPQAFYVLGMAEAARANWRLAQAAFTRALSLDPRNAEAWFDLAFVHVAEKNFESAEIAFRNAIANDSVDSAFGHNNIGVILAMRGDLASAKREFEAAYRSSRGQLKLALENLRLCESYGRSGVAGQLAWAGRNDRRDRDQETL